MKKILLTCFVALTTLAMASCHKEVDLAGTTWVASETVENETDCYTLAFADDKNGTVAFQTTYIDDEGHTMAFADTAAFVYTFDGEEDGTMTLLEGFGGDTANETYDIEYAEDDGDAAVLRVYVDIQAIVFKKQDK